MSAIFCGKNTTRPFARAPQQYRRRQKGTTVRFRTLPRSFDIRRRHCSVSLRATWATWKHVLQSVLCYSPANQWWMCLGKHAHTHTTQQTNGHLQTVSTKNRKAPLGCSNAWVLWRWPMEFLITWLNATNRSVGSVVGKHRTGQTSLERGVREG